MEKLVRLGSLLKTHRFVTALTDRLGEVIGFSQYAEGIDCKLESPDEEKNMHPSVLVYRIDAD